MSMVKIEHVNPNTPHSIAFDVMSPPRQGSSVRKDNTLTYDDGTVVTVDEDGNEIKDTFVLRHGEFRIFNLSGGLILHEVSMAALHERERKANEAAELEAEVARERKAKADAEHADKVKQEREAKKAEIEAAAAKPEDKPVDPPQIEKQPEPAV